VTCEGAWSPARTPGMSLVYIYLVVNGDVVIESQSVRLLYRFSSFLYPFADLKHGFV
jgi:hypothetical protein